MENPVVFGLATAALLIHIGLLISLVLFTLKKTVLPDIYQKMKVDRLYSRISEYNLEIAWIFAFVATTGSLYMLEILRWTPCRLCWIQRGFIYPLVVILGAAIYLERTDRDFSREILGIVFGLKDIGLTLAMICTPLALYHSIYQRFSQYISAGCSPTAISCSTKYTFHYNYISIPTLAFTAVLAIVLLLWRFNSTDY
jgi:disulfide bond formation protein DsbB